MFYMWRCVIVIAHADGVVTDKEKAYLNNVFTNMGRAYALTAEQESAFKDDMENEKKIADLLPYINDPAARSQLIYFGGLLARADGVLDPQEDAILKKLHADQLKSLDMDQIRIQVKAAVKDELFQHDLKMNSTRPQRGITAVLDRFLQWLGIDILG